MGFFDSVIDVVDKYGPIVKAGVGAYGTYAQGRDENKSRNEQASIIKAEQDKRNKDALAKQEYDINYQNQLNAANASNSAANSRAAAANRAASAATEANRRKAVKKAAGIEAKGYKAALENLQPIRDAGIAVLPGMQKTYTQALGTMQNLLGNFTTPDKIQALQSYTPTSAIQIPLPDRMKKA